MFQTINEKISVIGVYKQGTFDIKKFLWREKIYLIDETTLVTNIRDGQTKKRLYSVSVKGTLYRLLFNRDTEWWLLEQVWFDG